MNKNALHCVDYRINRSINEILTIDVRFVVPLDPRHSEEIAEALKKVELLLASENGVNFVQGSNKPRCCWCGVLAREDDKTCSQCGGAL